jgi:hypothetical protein
MKLNKVNALWIFILAFLISSEHVAAQDSSQSPVGTWQVVLKFPDGAQSQELLSISRDGRVLTTLFPPTDTPGSSRWGEWRRRGGAIDYTSYTILSANPDSGFLRARCRLSMESGGKTMAGNCAAELTDVDGNVIKSLTTLELTAKRLPLVPLD